MLLGINVLQFLDFYHERLRAKLCMRGILRKCRRGRILTKYKRLHNMICRIWKVGKKFQAVNCRLIVQQRTVLLICKSNWNKEKYELREMFLKVNFWQIPWFLLGLQGEECWKTAKSKETDSKTARISTSTYFLTEKGHFTNTWSSKVNSWKWKCRPPEFTENWILEP